VLLTLVAVAVVELILLQAVDLVVLEVLGEVAVALDLEILDL
jgi:hypothetical protein